MLKKESLARKGWDALLTKPFSLPFSPNIIGGILMSETTGEYTPALGNGTINPKVTVVGVGVAGSNIVNALKEHIEEIETVAINTDAQYFHNRRSGRRYGHGRHARGRGDCEGQGHHHGARDQALLGRRRTQA